MRQRVWTYPTATGVAEGFYVSGCTGSKVFRRRGTGELDTVTGAALAKASFLSSETV